MTDADIRAFDRHQWDRRDTLIYKLRLSALYHQKRARYYELSDKVLQAVAVLGSTGAVYELLATRRDVQLWLSGGVAVVSTLLLVFAPSTKANLHSNMVKDFRRLLAAVHAAGEYPEATTIDAWMSECVSLEAQEPCSLSALVAECEFQLSVGSGGTNVVRPAWWKRRLMHLIDFSPKAPPVPPKV